jgi:hypothetical protein
MKLKVKRNNTATKTQKIIYWFATVVLALGLLGTGIQQLLRVEAVGALGPPFAWASCSWAILSTSGHTGYMEIPRSYSNTHS